VEQSQTALARLPVQRLCDMLVVSVYRENNSLRRVGLDNGRGWAAAWTDRHSGIPTCAFLQCVATRCRQNALRVNARARLNNGICAALTELHRLSCRAPSIWNHHRNYHYPERLSFMRLIPTGFRF